MKLYCENCEKFLDFGEYRFEPPHDVNEMCSGELICETCGETLIV